MKQLLTILTLLGMTTIPALAVPGSIAGRVVDGQTGNAISGVPVFIYRMPVTEGDKPVTAVLTDRHGGFAYGDLSSGRYLIATRVGRRSQGCDVNDIFDGSNTFVKIAIGTTQASCSGKSVRTTLVDPNLTSDEYIIVNGH